MNYREQFYEGEIDGKTLLDVIAEKEAEAQALREEVEALRARVVVLPERVDPDYFDSTRATGIGWNACLDKLARLNGKAVSEGLLRRLSAEANCIEVVTRDRADAIHELRALLGVGKEVGDVLVRE